MKKNSIFKKTGLITLSIFLSSPLFADQSFGKIKSALGAVTGDIAGIFTTIVTLCYVIAAIIGLVGAVIVFNKYQHGDPNAPKLLSALIGGIIILIALATLLKAVFIG